VADRHRQAQPITQLFLQLLFPQPWATAITPARISQYQQLIGSGKDVQAARVSEQDRG
jgi:hypothetical protein